ncbi:tetratricopeptide repeat protein [Neosynechococcus sphagnicola]|uniref:tetratricopeptide repeat protein n=1 Tax=Neosynechococcus sphagnicola TaxID=1501145 RepID=UPI00195538A1|nr:tetratricopeptide repeat protein [Neosynechococcus sphagnicola]
MLKRRRKYWPLVSLVIGSGLLVSGGLFGLHQYQSRPAVLSLDQVNGNRQEDWLPHSMSSAQGMTQLTAIARHGGTPERYQARYLLATELIQQRQGQQALTWLQGLEQDYPVLAAQIALKRAQAYTASGDLIQAQAAWHQMLQRYPDNPAVVEALYVLGRQDGRYWQQAIAQFPAHPRTLEIVQHQLQAHPQQPKMLLVLAKHGVYLSGITTVLDTLVSQYGRTLQPQDWEAIAFAYWENQVYGKAGSAYAKAPRTALNLYRTARGLQLNDQTAAARLAYQQLIQAFPTAPETGLALMRMAKLGDPSQALAALGQVIQRFPERRAAALLAKANLLETLGNSEAATQARHTLLTQYGNSEAAAELRWTQAQQQAKAGNLAAARTWAQQIVSQNPESEVAAEATFWNGKWAQKLGQTDAAVAAFNRVLVQYPESYYAWRSAVMLGWHVGDFTTVRWLDPCKRASCTTLIPARRSELPSGSPPSRLSIN